MAGKHSILPRGLRSTRSPLFDGRFGRMFRQLPAANYGSTMDENRQALANLADAMEAPLDDPLDGPDPEESGIPALYTYLGQFIDHDLTYDPASTLMKANDPDALVDFRTPALDLDNLYGRGPSDQPYLYDGDRKLQLGDALTGQGVSGAFDLPRFRGIALIGDPRNDENGIVSQLQGLMLRFHNRLADDNPELALPDLQRLVRFHYQYVILNDFMPRLISASVLDELMSGGRYDKARLEFYHWRNAPFIPVEFSVAAYRLGHSMVRPGYRLNDDPAMLLPIFPTATHPDGLTGFQASPAGRAIDWGRFIDIDTRDYDGSDAAKQKRLQFSYKIDTSLVGPLSNLPPAIARDPPTALALRNLERGFSIGLPSGQQVARAMGVTPLTDDQIIIAKAVPEDPSDPSTKQRSIVDAAGEVFAGNCPLWTYVLAEAAQNAVDVELPVNGAVSVRTPQLGPVGGRIVAEVFLGMLFGDGSSLLSLDATWKPSVGASFALRDLVAYALGDGPPLH